MQHDSLYLSVLQHEYCFLEREARSYSSITWTVESDATAFLLAGGSITSLALRVTGKEVSYAPIAFFTAKMLINCEF